MDGNINGEKDNVINHLFPVNAWEKWVCDQIEKFPNFTIPAIYVACFKLKNNRSPNLGNIPPHIIKYFTKHTNLPSQYGSNRKNWKTSKETMSFHEGSSNFSLVLEVIPFSKKTASFTSIHRIICAMAPFDVRNKVVHKLTHKYHIYPIES